MSPAHAVPVVRSSAVWPIASHMERMGLPVERHLVGAGVPMEALDFPDLVVLERPLWTLFDRVRRLEGVEDFGFRVGASHRVTDVVGLRGPLSGHSTLLQAMNAFCTSLGAHSSSWDYWLEAAPAGIRICRRPSPIDVGEWPMEQYAVSYLVDLVRMAAPEDWWPTEIWLAAGQEPSETELAWLQGARLHLNSPVTARLVPERLLAGRVRGPSSPGTAEPSAVPLELDLVATLRHALRGYVGERRTALRDIGRVLGVHPRTLQRRLEGAGTTYQKVLDDTRLEVACARLREDQPIAGIAADLGYGDHAAFTRAFRRWAGVSPSRYRQVME